jgi:membrane protein
VRPSRWTLVTFGAVVAATLWLAISGAFAFYASRFGSYDKTWGALSGVVVMLTWLWLGSVALLLGGEVNAEVARSRGTVSEVSPPQ